MKNLSTERPTWRQLFVAFAALAPIHLWAIYHYKSERAAEANYRYGRAMYFLEDHLSSPARSPRKRIYPKDYEDSMLGFENLAYCFWNTEEGFLAHIRMTELECRVGSPEKARGWVTLAKRAANSSARERVLRELEGRFSECLVR